MPVPLGSGNELFRWPNLAPGMVPGLRGTPTPIAFPPVSTSLTVTAVFELRSDARTASDVFPNFVDDVIAAVTVAPVSGRTTEIELEDMADSFPVTEMIVSYPLPLFCGITISE